MSQYSLSSIREDGTEETAKRTSSPKSAGTAPSRDVIPMTKITIFSADSDLAAQWQSAVDEIGRVASVQTPGELGTVIASSRSDIVLFDLNSSTDIDYRQLPELYSKRYPDTAFIYMTPRPSEAEGLYLVSNGGMGYCNRYISPALLTKAVEVVRMGEIWLGRKLLFKLMENVAQMGGAASGSPRDSVNNKLAELTEREHEIALLVGEGASNKVIAGKLDITERTVKAHISSIFRKTGSKDRLQLGLLINT